MLRHLIVDCPFGWCNRMRMIHSGIRVAQHYGARLTIVFPEGDLRSLIDLPEWIETSDQTPDVAAYTRYSCHYGCRPLDFSRHEYVYCSGYSRFEDASFPKFDLALYSQLKPSSRVLENAAQLEQATNLPPGYIGMHIRRGDHTWCRQDVSDGMVIDCLCDLLGDTPDERIVLSTEDARERKNLILTQLQTLKTSRIQTPSQNQIRKKSLIQINAQKKQSVILVYRLLALIFMRLLLLARE